jgi:hypothetical protein
MKIGSPLLKILNKNYQPSSLHELKFGRYDLALKTDDLGRPTLLFIGHKNAAGKIEGERFTRRIVADGEGNVIKDHWDNKGKINNS